MPILNPTDFIDVTETEPYLVGQENVILQKCFNAGSSIRLLEHVNTLNGVKFEKCVFSNFNWMNKSIRKNVIFQDCLFKGGATSFENAKFEQDVSFNGCVFEDNVSFDNTIFNQDVSFQYIHTLGNPESAFLFRGDTIPHTCSPKYSSSYDFSNSVFENNAVFNYRQFDKCTSFIDVDFQYYFFFADSDLGHKTIFSNVHYSCVKNIATNPHLDKDKLLCCFENLQACLKKSERNVYYQELQQIIDHLSKNDSTSIQETGDDFVNKRYILEKTNWEAGTLSKYTRSYPYYFEKKGIGQNTLYKWSKIQEFLSASKDEKAAKKVATDPQKNKKKGYHYASNQ